MELKTNKLDFPQRLIFHEPQKEFWPLVHKMIVDEHKLMVGTTKPDTVVQEEHMSWTWEFYVGGRDNIVLLVRKDGSPLFGRNEGKTYQFYNVKTIVANSGISLKIEQGNQMMFDDLVNLFVEE